MPLNQLEREVLQEIRDELIYGTWSLIKLAGKEFDPYEADLSYQEWLGLYLEELRRTETLRCHNSDVIFRLVRDEDIRIYESAFTSFEDHSAFSEWCFEMGLYGLLRDSTKWECVKDEVVNLPWDLTRSWEGTPIRTSHTFSIKQETRVNSIVA